VKDRQAAWCWLCRTDSLLAEHVVAAAVITATSAAYIIHHHHQSINQSIMQLVMRCGQFKETNREGGHRL